jgi:saccharopine dehydrogenase-like NADP-dependent oxidoreductase
MRYEGHHKHMKFLLDDLNLSKNRELFTQIFDQEVPQTTQDVVIIMVKAVGLQGGKLKEKTYYKKVYGNEYASAIQQTTVSGICAAMHSWMHGSIADRKGFVKQEDIDWDSYTNNPWGKIFVS